MSIGNSLRTSGRYVKDRREWRRAKRAVSRRPLGVESLESRIVLAVTAVTSVSDLDFLFDTDNQNMWQQGPGDIITETFEWGPGRISFQEDTIGGFVSLPNPGRPIYDAAFASCKGIGFSDSECRDGGNLPGLGPRPSDSVERLIYDPLLAACKALGFSTTTCVNGASVGGLGSRPSATLAPSGVKADLNAGHVELGVKGGVEINPGQINVDYQTDLGLSATGASGIRAGQTFTINTSIDNVDTATMSTDFPDIEAYAGVFADVDLSGKIQAQYLGVSKANENYSLNTNGRKEFEVIRATAGQSAGIDVTG